MFFGKTKEEFLTGNEAVVKGALAAGATFMAGYPITPATEILEEWAAAVTEQKSAESASANPRHQRLQVLQAEDETSAGFNVIGALLAGLKAFTATAGPGHILMQDPIAMAEAMRLPFVGVVMQRGGPSTGTVIYGQQEVTLACYGGNGEGLRVVYSTSGPQELYDYTIKAFNIAWYYRFPTFVLGDGYQSRMKKRVKLNKPSLVKPQPVLGDEKTFINIRNCFNFEDELYENLKKDLKEYQKVRSQIIEWEEYKCKDAEEVIFAHGIVAGSAKQAIDILRTKMNKKIGLFRPITLRPFPEAPASQIAARAHKILIIESSNGHFTRLVKDNLYGLTKIETLLKPVMSIDPAEIVQKIKTEENFWTDH